MKLKIGKVKKDFIYMRVGSPSQLAKQESKHNYDLNKEKTTNLLNMFLSNITTKRECFISNWNVEDNKIKFYSISDYLIKKLLNDIEVVYIKAPIYKDKVKSKKGLIK